MGTAGLQAALLRGEPLADVIVKFRAGVDGVSATERINALADDFDLLAAPLYDDPKLRIATATRDALERMFGWKLTRAKLPGQPPAAPTIYWWAEVSPVNGYLPELRELVESVGLTQPGSDDDGQWYEYR
jgi:hypothetical protein